MWTVAFNWSVVLWHDGMCTLCMDELAIGVNKRKRKRAYLKAKRARRIATKEEIVAWSVVDGWMQ